MLNISYLVKLNSLFYNKNKYYIQTLKFFLDIHFSFYITLKCGCDAVLGILGVIIYFYSVKNGVFIFVFVFVSSIVIFY